MDVGLKVHKAFEGFLSQHGNLLRVLQLGVDLVKST